MDFALPLVATESTASQSRIRYCESTTASSDDALENGVIHAANQAAYELFWGPSSMQPDTRPSTKKKKQRRNSQSNDKKEEEEEHYDKEETTPIIPSFDPEFAWMLDASVYKDRVTPRHSIIQPGDLVVIQESFDSLDFVYVQPGAIYQNRNGNFHHDDFIGQPFGTKVRSRDLRGYGFLYLLKPTPELWTRSLNHRTQVVHELDQSQILFQLYLRPNQVVVESGTGSGALSHALIRAIAPSGQLHTYEYNRHRAETARHEFQQHGLAHLVTVHHKDVCRGQHVPDEATPQEQPDVSESRLGFDLPPASVHAVVLDLPEPWLAVPHAARVLRPNGRLASYSPCVEQTQRTIRALEKHHFHSIKTMEYRLQEHYVDEVAYEPPPARKLSRPAPHDLAAYAVATTTLDDDDQEEVNETTTTAVLDSDLAIEEDGEKDDTQALRNGGMEPPPCQRKMLVARPFVMMRGHTAFLTFATAGLATVGPEPGTEPTTSSNENER